MRGRFHSSTRTLPERDVHDLSDLLAIKIYRRLGRDVYALSRREIGGLVEPYTDDLGVADRRAVTWHVWRLLQRGRELEGF